MPVLRLQISQVTFDLFCIWALFSYSECMFLWASTFRWHQRFWPCDLEFDPKIPDVWNRRTINSCSPASTSEAVLIKLCYNIAVTSNIYSSDSVKERVYQFGFIEIFGRLWNCWPNFYIVLYYKIVSSEKHQQGTCNKFSVNVLNSFKMYSQKCSLGHPLHATLVHKKDCCQLLT